MKTLRRVSEAQLKAKEILLWTARRAALASKEANPSCQN